MPFSTQTLEAAARCLDCGHPLAGLEHARCPECGRAFHHDLPETWRDANSTSILLRWASPPGPLTLALITAIAGYILWHASRLVHGWFDNFPPVLIAMAGAGFLFLRCIPPLVVAFCGRTGHLPSQRFTTARWLLAIAIPTGTAILTAADAPRAIRWRLSEPALRAHAQAHLRSGLPTVQTNRMVGLIPITHTETRNGRVLLFTEFFNLFDAAVLIYTPPSQTPTSGNQVIDQDWSLIILDQ